MLTLYHRPGCFYCRTVIEAAKQLGAELDLRDTALPEHADELVRRGGKRQVPYLVDDEKGVAMYESEDIIEYLHQRFNRSPVRYESVTTITI